MDKKITLCNSVTSQTICKTDEHLPDTKAPFTRYNLLSNRFDNRLYHVHKHSTGCQTHLTTGCIVYTPGCQTGLYNRFERTVAVRSTRLSNRIDNLFDNRLYRINKHPTGCQSGLTFVYMIQPVVQPVVLRKRGITMNMVLMLPVNVHSVELMVYFYSYQINMLMNALTR